MIGRAVMAGLQDGGYTVDWVRDGLEATPDGQAVLENPGVASG